MSKWRRQQRKREGKRRRSTVIWESLLSKMEQTTQDLQRLTRRFQAAQLRALATRLERD